MTTLAIVSRDESLARVASDQRVREILDVALARPGMLWLVFLAIREYTTLNQLERGRGDGALNFAAVIGRQRFSGRERSQADRIRMGLVGLYRDHEPGVVRGVLLEQLAEQQIRSRYAGARHLCDNNLTLRLSNETTDHTTSKSVDVVGWDLQVGEFHDCKADASRFEPPWVRELEQDVAPFGLRIGLVTADGESSARRKLARAQIRITSAQLVTEESLSNRLPLQP